MAAHIQHGDAGATVGEAVPMARGHPFDETVKSYAAQVLRHLAAAVGILKRNL
jgi:hypothetical protein